MQNEIALCYKAPIQGPTVVFTDTHTHTHTYIKNTQTYI